MYNATGCLYSKIYKNVLWYPVFILLTSTSFFLFSKIVTSPNSYFIISELKEQDVVDMGSKVKEYLFRQRGSDAVSTRMPISILGLCF